MTRASKVMAREPDGLAVSDTKGDLCPLVRHSSSFSKLLAQSFFTGTQSLLTRHSFQ